MKKRNILHAMLLFFGLTYFIVPTNAYGMTIAMKKIYKVLKKLGKDFEKWAFNDYKIF